VEVTSATENSVLAAKVRAAKASVVLSPTRLNLMTEQLADRASCYRALCLKNARTNECPLSGTAWSASYDVVGSQGE
jgi:hypothetical protein